MFSVTNSTKNCFTFDSCVNACTCVWWRLLLVTYVSSGWCHASQRQHNVVSDRTQSRDSVLLRGSNKFEWLRRKITLELKENETRGKPLSKRKNTPFTGYVTSENVD